MREAVGGRANSVLGRRITFGLLILACIVLVVGVVTFDALFEEPAARRISSLVSDTGCRSVLAIFAHPDDEILVAATLADAAKRGCSVHTVTATRGEQGVPHNFVGDRAKLARLREGELRQCGAAIGVQGQELWNFPDGRLAEVALDPLLDSISAAIRRYRPDLVLTLDSVAGFTGHPDHRRIGEAAVLAARRASDPLRLSGGDSSPPRWIAHVVFPRRAALLIPDQELRRLLRQQPRADVAVEGNLRLKLLAMKIHRTQQQFFPPAWVRPLLYRFYDREHFAVVPLSPGQ
jgi:LmbE family N-acetylglucosaminyl deacetylase